MKHRYTNGRLLVAIVIISITVLSSVTYFWFNYSSNGAGYYKLDFVSAMQVNPVSVDGAGWQIKLTVGNIGNQDLVLERIYVNDKLVSENGLIHGEKLSSTWVIGSSLPDIGAFIQPGRSETVYLWLGSELFRKGETLTIELQNQDQMDLKKTVTIN